MMLRLDRDSRTPLYLQIRNQLREMILDGTLSEGSRLPPERKMAVALGVNRSTVVNAYRELAADGLVEARVGRGTTVCRVPVGEGSGSEAVTLHPFDYAQDKPDGFDGDLHPGAHAQPHCHPNSALDGPGTTQYWERCAGLAGIRHRHPGHRSQEPAGGAQVGALQRHSLHWF